MYRGKDKKCMFLIINFFNITTDNNYIEINQYLIDYIFNDGLNK